MKAFLLVCGAVITVTGACLGFAQDDDAKPKAAAPQKTDSKQQATDKNEKNKDEERDASKAKALSPATQGDAKSEANEEADDDEDSSQITVPEKYAADAKAIRETHKKLLEAYCADDAKAVAALFSEEGEYVNAADELFQGREDIQSTLAEFMEDHPGCSVDSQITAMRFLGPSLALVNGTFTVKHTSDTEHAEDTGPVTRSRFNAVYSKNADKWQIASIRDQAPSKVKTSHEDQLAALEFLHGEWIDQDHHSSVSFNCKPIDGGKFLLREFSLSVGNREVLSGSQRIGWDPLSDRIRTWIFDSEGGFAEGVWQQEGDNRWIVQAAGVTAEGKVATGTSVYELVDDHTMTWQSVDHEVDGVPVADSPVFTLTRRPPSPGTAEDEAKIGLKP